MQNLFKLCRKLHFTFLSCLSFVICVTHWKIVLIFGFEFSGHPCSVALREQREGRFWKESKMSIVYRGKEDSSGPRITLLESLPESYDCWLKTKLWYWDDQLSCWKIKNGVKKNFEDKANNKQLDKVKDDTIGSNMNHMVSNLA